MPVGMELAKNIEAHKIPKAKKLLVQYKEDVKNYLASCDQSKDKFEETSIMIHTYEARLEDVEYDMTHEASNTDCSKVPDSTKLEAAFKSKETAQIKALYEAYEKDAHHYINDCASHAEYETVYESSMMFDEEYEAWHKK
jgi:Na+-translocating ferredoxin:NAD+ oxidoreductase RnfC subunit